MKHFSGGRREAWSGDGRRRRWKVQTSSVDDLDLSGSPSTLSEDDGTIKIKVIDENRDENSYRNSTRRQNIFILKVIINV